MEILAENLKMQDMRSKDEESQLKKMIDDLNYKIRYLEDDNERFKQQK